MDLTGLLLLMNVNSTPPGASGALPGGTLSGLISTNSSGASLLFSSNNITTAFGMLPGVTIGGGGQSVTYQILNASLGLQAPTVGNPIGQTTIQGAVTSLNMAANAGTTPQSAAVNAAFANALAVTLKEGATNIAVVGANVTFTAPASGPSGLFSNSTATITVVTNASGVASAPFTANAIVGGPYNVVASAAGVPPVNFLLSNKGASVSYNTSNSSLSCNGIPGCTTNSATSVTKGGITLTYNSGSGSNIVTPSLINLGNLVFTGTGSNVDMTGLLLTINVNSTPPGAAGALPGGTLSGLMSTANSSVTIAFSPNNTTTGFGTLPSVTIAVGGQSFTYQVLNTNLGLVSPTDGNPIGQTSIQGTVSQPGPSLAHSPCDMDIDGNGTIDALTDGLMLLRAMFGLTGTAVTQGAVGSGSPSRSTWAQIQPYLNANCGTNFAP